MSMFHAALTQTADTHAGNRTATDTIPDAPQPPTLVWDCLAVIDDYRRGIVSLVCATIRVYKLLPDSDTSTEAFDAFIEQLTAVDRECDAAATHGIRANGYDDDDKQHDAGEPSNVSTADPTGDAPHVHVPAGTKRPADRAFTPNAAISTIHAPDESLYPWNNSPAGTELMDPLIAKTLTPRANYLLDVKCTKNDLLVRANCPPFPDGLWTDVLLDQYIDFDRVFSGYYATESDT